MKRLILAFVGLAALSTGALAQSRSSFWDASNVTDILINQLDSKTWTIGLGANPTVTVNGHLYHVTDAFAFYGLADNNTFAATGSTQNGWTYDENYAGSGGIAGWKTNPNTGLTPNSAQLTFQYSTVNLQPDNYGFHFRFSETDFEGTGGNTAFVAVPEPATIAVLGLGALAAIRRRKKQA